jgi:hemoglobin-like flavoprotein
MEDLRTAVKAAVPLTDEEVEQAWETIYKKLARQHTSSIDWVRAGIEFTEKLYGIRK